VPRGSGLPARGWIGPHHVRTVPIGLHRVPTAPTGPRPVTAPTPPKLTSSSRRHRHLWAAECRRPSMRPRPRHVRLALSAVTSAPHGVVCQARPAPSLHRRPAASHHRQPVVHPRPRPVAAPAEAAPTAAASAPLPRGAPLRPPEDEVLRQQPPARCRAPSWPPLWAAVAVAPLQTPAARRRLTAGAHRTLWCSRRRRRRLPRRPQVARRCTSRARQPLRRQGGAVGYPARASCPRPRARGERLPYSQPANRSRVSKCGWAPPKPRGSSGRSESLLVCWMGRSRTSGLPDCLPPLVAGWR